MVIQFFFDEVTYGPHRIFVICQVNVDILGNVIDRIAFFFRNLKNLTRDLTEFHLLGSLSRVSFVVGAISVLSKKEAKKKHRTGIREETKRRFSEFFPNIRDIYHRALFKALLNDFINCNFHL